MSLDRLIKLAKRTGDRLIVHNPADEIDIVIMDVSEYENLLDEKKDVRGLSERELLNQINRDIAIWRANDKLESEQEEEFSATGGPAGGWDFEDNKSDWHGVGSVIENMEKEEENLSKGLILDDEPVFYEEPV